MTVSVAMATFNGAKYVKEQLESFSSQTILPDEIVICDDASTDETVLICEQFSLKSPVEIRIYRNEINLGYRKNFEKVLSLCTSDVIFLSDQDDVWYNHKIKTVLDEFETNKGTQLLIHDLQYCNSDLIRSDHSKIERISTFSNPEKTYVTGMATAVKGNFLKACLPIPEEYRSGHDNWLHECAYFLGVKSIIHLKLADYRRHEANATSFRKINEYNYNSGSKSLTNVKIKHMLKKRTVELGKKQSKYLALSTWLASNKNILISTGIAKPEVIDNKVKFLEATLDNIEKRKSAISNILIIKIVKVIKLYARGTYNSYGGLRAALKDVISS
jgi:glycosyltransferase involved in cell wall biosynthesis